MTFVDDWRRRKSAAFDLAGNSSAGRAIEIELFGARRQIYANANLSLYSGQACNARCPFCVEELRPASRGAALARRIEPDDQRYFDRLEQVLTALAPLDPSVSITGGEPSIDPRLPRLLAASRRGRKRTLTSNGTGLLEEQGGRAVIDWIAASGIEHLNISRAHPADQENARLMRLPAPMTAASLREVVARAGPARVRLSCVLLRRAIGDLEGVLAYTDFARSIGIDQVIFRQLMQSDPATHAKNFVVAFSDRQRAPLEPLLDRISRDPRFRFERQVVGYYYYVEVWRLGEMTVVFEEADLAQLERSKRTGVIHELVFHPDGNLASTWQPWDGVLGP